MAARAKAAVGGAQPSPASPSQEMFFQVIGGRPPHRPNTQTKSSVFVLAIDPVSCHDLNPKCVA